MGIGYNVDKPDDCKKQPCAVCTAGYPPPTWFVAPSQWSHLFILTHTLASRRLQCVGQSIRVSRRSLQKC